MDYSDFIKKYQGHSAEFLIYDLMKRIEAMEEQLESTYVIRFDPDQQRIIGDHEKENEQLNPDAPWRDVAKQNIELEKKLKKYRDIIEQLKDPLSWADEMLTARDEMNAKIHCSPVKFSEITLRLKAATKSLEELNE